MSTYQRPLQPWDPIVPDQQPKPPIRYVRDNFQGTGQDSHTQPPAQDPAMWQALTNVQPITKGVLERRWGYLQFATGVNAAATRLSSFQRDSDGLRTIVAQGQGSVTAYNEAGTFYANVFAPTGAVVRSLSSRNYQYFYDGQAPDLIKWNGNVTGGTSNWGIDATNVTANGGGSLPATFGPNAPTTAADVAFGGTAWANIANIKTDTGTYASCTLGTTTLIGGKFIVNEPTTSDYAQATHFGFSTVSGTISGIKVQVKLAGTTGIPGNIPCQFTAALMKAGSLYGQSRSVTVNSSSLTQISLGGTTDLWGGTWTPADINGVTTFGVSLYANGFGPVKISAVKITVYVGQGGGATTSGSGVGIASTAAGAVNLTIGRTYYLTFFNALTGHFSDLTPASASTGPLTSKEINLLLATNNDPQVTHKYLLATADGNDPSILYLVAELINGGGGDVTTYTDNTPDPTLVLNQIFLYTDQFGNEFGITLNTPPPAGTLGIKHQGRLWMAGVPQATHSVYFSKSINELTLPNGFIAGKYEEAWPLSNYFDVSDGAESVAGLISDGQTLYIGTQYHIRRVTGNSPTNFSLPEIVHPQVGVINQEVWQIVYTQGSPSGSIWLTPDFKVIQSDFNTYADIGIRVQDILNNLQPTAPQLAHAAFVADGEYDLYILAVPYQQSTYCDTHLVYDMRHQMWFVWTPFGGSQALLFNVSANGASQWLFLNGTGGSINQYSSATTTDNNTAFQVSATTSWLGLGEVTQRKILNEVEYDGDPAMLLSINGALVQSDFATPLVMSTNLASVVGPLGTRKYFVAAQAIKARYLQFIFSSTSTTNIVLGSYNFEVVPFNDL